MEENNLYSKTIDAVEIFSNSNLLLETNTQIQFNTPQLLINFIPFNEFIKNIVFQTDITTPPLDRDSANIEVNGNSARDLTEAYDNNATLTVDNVYCSNISANGSKVDIGGTSKYHCITLSTSNNLILRNTGGYNNIEYNSNNNLSSLSNYIYHILNETQFTEDDLTANAYTFANARDISSFGTYFTNKIITSNVYTSNVGDSGGKESILGISSDSAVNLHIYQDAGVSFDARNIASNIILSDNVTSSNLKDYIYSFLDETVVYQLEISGTGNPGVDITLDNITFTRTTTGTIPFIKDPFTYNIVFKIYEYDASETATNPVGDVANPIYPNTKPILDNVIPINPGSDTLVAGAVLSSTETLTFRNLTAGTFYSIYADITNNVTNTTVNNVRVDYSIPTIEHITNLSITVKNEYEIDISFIPHATIISNWNTEAKRVYFYLSIGLITYPSSGNTIDVDSNENLNLNILLSTSSRSPLQKTLQIVNNSEYSLKPHDNVSFTKSTLKVDSNFMTLETSFAITSFHDNDVSSTFTMTSDYVTMPRYQFVAPSIPTNLNIIKTLISWDWTKSSGDKIKMIYFNIYKDNTKINTASTIVFNANSPTYSILSADFSDYFSNNILDSTNIDNNRGSTRGIKAGSYNIEAYNIFDQMSSKSSPYTVNQLTISLNSLLPPTTNDKKWTIVYTLDGINGTATKEYYTKTSSSKTPLLGDAILLATPDTYQISLFVSDNCMELRSSDIVQQVHAPTINYTTVNHVSSSTRQYSTTISISGNTSLINSITLQTDSSYSGTYDSGINASSPTISGNTITFTFNNTNTSFDLKQNIQVEDEYGYTNTKLISQRIDVGFQTTPNIEYRERVFELSVRYIDFYVTFSPAITTNYTWTIDDVAPQTGSTTNILSLEDSDSYARGDYPNISENLWRFGIIKFEVTETNSAGFSKVHSNTLQNREPINSDINVSVFTIDTFISFTATYSLSATGSAAGLNTNQSSDFIVFDGYKVVNYNTPGDYALFVIVRNNISLHKLLQDVATFRVYAPDITKTLSSQSISYFSITLNYTYNVINRGTPEDTISSSRIYYHTSSFDETNFSSLSSYETITENTNQPITISALEPGTTYYFRIVIQFNNYPTQISNQEDETTREGRINPPIIVYSDNHMEGYIGSLDKYTIGGFAGGFALNANALQTGFAEFLLVWNQGSLIGYTLDATNPYTIEYAPASANVYEPYQNWIEDNITVTLTDADHRGRGNYAIIRSQLTFLTAFWEESYDINYKITQNTEEGISSSVLGRLRPIYDSPFQNEVISYILEDGRLISETVNYISADSVIEITYKLVISQHLIKYNSEVFDIDFIFNWEKVTDTTIKGSFRIIGSRSVTRIISTEDNYILKTSFTIPFNTNILGSDKNIKLSWIYSYTYHFPNNTFTSLFEWNNVEGDFFLNLI
jgi:hypothetical protein